MVKGESLMHTNVQQQRWKKRNVKSPQIFVILVSYYTTGV